MVSDKLNHRWVKANRKTKGGWSPKSQYYANHQQRRLLEREKNMTYKLLAPSGMFLKVPDVNPDASEDFDYTDAEYQTSDDAEAALQELNRPGVIVVGECEDGVIDRLGN